MHIEYLWQEEIGRVDSSNQELDTGKTMISTPTETRATTRPHTNQSTTGVTNRQPQHNQHKPQWLAKNTYDSSYQGKIDTKPSCKIDPLIKPQSLNHKTRPRFLRTDQPVWEVVTVNWRNSDPGLRSECRYRALSWRPKEEDAMKWL